MSALLTVGSGLVYQHDSGITEGASEIFVFKQEGRKKQSGRGEREGGKRNK